MVKMFGTLLMTVTLWAGFAQGADRMIVVNGTSEKGMDPNMVSMTVEVWSKAQTAKAAQQAAATQFKQVKKVFDDFKVKKEDIQTDNYALNPEYVYDQKTQTNKMVGFRVVQSLMVTLRKVDDAGPFLDALVTDKQTKDFGVNVNSINWDSDKRSQAEVAALGDAVRAAKVKAEEIAKAAGVKIKGVARISHGASAIQPPMPMVRNFAMKAMADSAPTELSAGQIKVRIEVTAEYEIN
ncbi:SIMPL domain-containing protein [Bdellovibrio sp. HCB209]|uniref:SIMPL domain-containing protein n=1 Tax=Bdellovibrio sp. HCB209 TaxID=3394354 RepID=UPI0039B50F94